MRIKIKKIIDNAPSFNLFQVTDYDSLVPKGTPESRIRQHWEGAGFFLRQAMDGEARKLNDRKD